MIWFFPFEKPVYLNEFDIEAIISISSNKMNFIQFNSKHFCSRASHCSYAIWMQRNNSGHIEAFTAGCCKNGGEISTTNYSIAGILLHFIRYGANASQQFRRIDSGWWNLSHSIRIGETIWHLHRWRYNYRKGSDQIV